MFWFILNAATDYVGFLTFQYTRKAPAIEFLDRNVAQRDTLSSEDESFGNSTCFNGYFTMEEASDIVKFSSNKSYK